MKFKVGDTVRVIRCGIHKNCKHIDTIGKIIDIVANRCYPYELADCDELFREDELVLVQEKQFTKANFKVGDIVTYRNGNKKTFISNILIDENGYIGKHLSEYNDELKAKSYDGFDIVKVERPVKYETVFERKEEVLDAAEKKYLAGVIRPFRDKTKCIEKCSYSNEFIEIYIKEDEPIVLPNFEKGTMYKGMNANRKYTLKELGL